MTTTTLPTTALGMDGLEVGAQGLGCMGISEFYGPSDLDESRATLDRALELGITLFDTADIYGSGHNEEFLSDFVRANREQVVLATKFGIVRKADDPAFRGFDNSPDYIRESVDGSLRRLGIDVIDLYYMHRRDVRVPIEETVAVMAELVAAGKVRALGLSEVTGAELRAAHAVHPIAAVQSEWSLFSRDVERSAVPAAAELGVAFVPYSPLGRGFLTGSFATAGELAGRDFRKAMPRFSGDNAARNAALLAPVHSIAAARGVTPAQVALAWVHARSDAHGLPVVPIPGTRSRTRLAENVAAATLALTADELATLEPIAEQVAGNRYADMSFTSAGRE
ncbi:aldo/keto reductase [Nocardia puris]|uniref:Aryl-alcohol dehydrogenase-like predicted oxidoreductase n=1 Tax=Nocardia puris TaxID=208602 RepID=A0A366DNG6_9NOCA|nr:aldo/keto reductase [Nocardia puris]MBF6211473.1 aldo/keto reductase [Nocardia puris]MBF6369534.1 aldo/keto reductase [Nocardia puris]MBF6458975.1 aldo/keto reductase [Nocardia puris]RBO90834.1 aryl-alcohol dehydrogenase-like predicted oxidoreductase [Nocardia puris]